MWVATVLPKPVPPVLSVLTSSRNPKQSSFHFRFSYRPLNLKVSATKQQQQLPEPKADKKNPSSSDLGWLPAFPHVLIASMSNFLFGYHIGVMNGPIVSVAKELGFEGNSTLEGLVVSIFIAGAFLGSVASGSLVDKLGCRRTFQLDTIPLILGALVSAQAHSLDEILWGRFLVGLGIGVNTVLVPIYISEVAPTKYRGSLGTLCQIGTCLGIIASLFLDIPSETDPHWWRTILYIASAPGFILALGMQFAVESPRWLCKVGRLDDAKTVIRNIWGSSEVETAIQDFQSVIKNNGVNVGFHFLKAHTHSLSLTLKKKKKKSKMLLQLFQTYKIPILQATLSISLSFLLTFLKVPIFFLQGLHTYIQPENLGQQNGGGGIKAAIRRPSSSDSGSGLDGYQNLSSKTNNAEVKRRNYKSKEKLEFDENKAQIFRLKLDQGHLQTRLYFGDYWYSFVYSFVALSCFLLYEYSGGVKDYGVLVNGSLIPVILSCFVLCKVFVSLAKVSFEKSASKKSEKQLSLIFGVVGFVFGLIVCSGIASSVFDFDFSSLDGFGRVFVAVLMGCFAGFLYIPAGKNARSFWIGTDQIRSNLAMIYCGWFGRMILYANYLLGVFAALLWINPFAQILYSKNVNYSYGMYSNGSVGEAEMLVGNVGFTESDFNKFRLCCLFLSGIFQILALRPNVQMYLNEALLSWYQRLHASKIPDLDFSRAKVFLHNHYLCLVVLQFFAMPILVLLFLSLSQIDGVSFKKLHLWCDFIPCTAFVKEVTLFMAWWIVFVWAAFTSTSLVFYRWGTLYVS